jgi:REP element-mobilizing transposase RayT
MSNTYTQINIQIVFAVSKRENLISKNNREELHKYITTVIENKGQKLLAIFAMPNHIHILIGMRPNIALSDLVRDIKSTSSNFINSKKWGKGKFNWQNGFGAFSYSNSQLDRVIKYVLNQEKHHKRKSFKEEYLEFLSKFEIDYDEKYLFDWIDDDDV